MIPTDAQIEMGARNMKTDLKHPIRRFTQARCVLTPVLSDIEARIEALPHTDWTDPNGRPRPCPQEWPGGPCTCIRGQALAIVRGDLS